jgi:hypothetical protein
MVRVLAQLSTEHPATVAGMVAGGIVVALKLSEFAWGQMGRKRNGERVHLRTELATVQLELSKLKIELVKVTGKLEQAVTRAKNAKRDREGGE